MTDETMPDCSPTIRTIAMPADLNYEGDVFGGWLMSQMDLAGGVAARWRSQGKVVTVAVEGMQFHLPMHPGDELSCYCVLLKLGKTSLTYRIEAWARRRQGGDQVKITQAVFTFVAIGPDRKPRVVPPETEASF